MSQSLRSFTKDPDEQLDYSVDWSKRLQSGETIDSAEWIVDPNDGTLTVVAETASDTAATVWLSGGTLGTTYRVTSRIVTTESPNPRKFDGTIGIEIQQR